MQGDSRSQMRLPACVDSSLKRFFGPNWQVQSVLGGGRSQSTLYRISTTLDSTLDSTRAEPRSSTSAECNSHSDLKQTRDSSQPSTQGQFSQGLLGCERSVVLKATRRADGTVLQQIHRYQRHLSLKLGSWVSSPLSWRTGELDETDTILIDDDEICWEWMRWLPGSVIARVGEVNEQQLRSVARCLGAVHRESSQSLTKKETIAFGRLSETRDTRMEDRVLRLRRVAKDGWGKTKSQGAKLARNLAQGLISSQGSELIRDISSNEHFAFRSEVLRTKLEWIFHGIESRSVEWIRPLEQLAERVQRNTASECSWGHGDAWRGNWLFEGQQVSGLIDFGQAGFRWKGFDFARLFGSLISETIQLPRGSSASVSHAWEIAWEVYCGEHPTPGYRLEDAILMHRISTILTLELLLDRINQSAVSRFDFDRLEEIVEMSETMF